MPELKPYALTSPSRHAAGHARWAFALVLSAGLLAGCGYTRAQQACQQPVPEASTTLRVMVQFHQPVAGDAPEVLDRLQSHSQGCVSYVSSVSPTVHVYAISGTGDWPSLRAGLKQWSAVQDVVADAKALPAKAH